MAGNHGGESHRRSHVSHSALMTFAVLHCRLYWNMPLIDAVAEECQALSRLFGSHPARVLRLVMRGLETCLRWDAGATAWNTFKSQEQVRHQWPGRAAIASCHQVLMPLQNAIARAWKYSPKTRGSMSLGYASSTLLQPPPS